MTIKKPLDFTPDTPDMVNHPPHYSHENPLYEPINVIEQWKLNFHLGNAVKYIARAERKNDPIEDLKKAAWYLNRELARRTGQTDV